MRPALPLRATALCATLLAAPAAAGTVSLPAGCEGLVTMQANDCVVTHYFRCETDPADWTRRLDYNEEGLIFRTLTDPEARWMESEHVRAGVTDVLGAERDPNSLSDLLATGRDDFDFLTYSSNGAQQRFTGYDSLSGADEVIDGVALKGTAFEMRVEDSAGNWLWSAEGREYVMPEWGVFIGGRRTITGPGFDPEQVDGRPQRFDFPGDAGFLATTPEYGCGLMMSSLTRAPA